MKLQLKFIAVFLAISCSSIAISYIAIVACENSLKNSIGQTSITLASKIMNDVDQDIYNKLILFETLSNTDLSKQVLIESNNEFSKIPNVGEYISQNERNWTSTENIDSNPLVLSTLDSPLSTQLKTTSEYLKDTTYYSIISQMTVTNAYGVNVATTGWTEHYSHATESWWQEAKNNYVYVGENSLSPQRSAIDFAIRIDDSNGNFIGVRKVVMNLDEIINVIKDAQRNAEYPSTEIMLLTHDGRLIYSTSDSKIYDDLSKESFFTSITQSQGEFEDQENQTGKLVAYSRSIGYSDYRGLGWILVIKYNTDEVLQPVSETIKFIEYATVATIIAAAVASWFVSKHLAKRITLLRNAASKIAEGDFTIRVDTSGNDEIHDLAKDIDSMASDLKSSTDKLLANERLSAIGELAARIAHDLRNPLNVIKNGLEIIEIKNSSMDEKSREIFTRIRRSVWRMTHQIDEVLDYIQVKPLNLTEQKVSNILASTIESMVIPSTVDINLPQNDGTVLCDFEKICIVFSNLITNSIQAMDNRGQIDIKVYEEAEVLRIDVIDSGPGIPEEIVGRIFEPLFTTKQVGTGLGLVSCKSILERHGGSISVKNRPTTFTIIIPRMSREVVVPVRQSNSDIVN